MSIVKPNVLDCLTTVVACVLEGLQMMLKTGPQMFQQ